MSGQEANGGRRWRLSHEFYNLGHMVEGAIAHYQATGKRNFLDIAIRYADCVCREIVSTGEGQPSVCRDIRLPKWPAKLWQQGNEIFGIKPNSFETSADILPVRMNTVRRTSRW